ncbi:MAG: hypothetical protein M1828_002167 [Chrysothrix sp. TS-e1954]|nr:MAG: hypothetical protein M1828_002167 [Chrysothrix sp. TS-e1954]
MKKGGQDYEQTSETRGGDAEPTSYRAAELERGRIVFRSSKDGSGVAITTARLAAQASIRIDDVGARVIVIVEGGPMTAVEMAKTVCAAEMRGRPPKRAGA